MKMIVLEIETPYWCCTCTKCLSIYEVIFFFFLHSFFTFVERFYMKRTLSEVICLLFYNCIQYFDALSKKFSYLMSWWYKKRQASFEYLSFLKRSSHRMLQAIDYSEKILVLAYQTLKYYDFQSNIMIYFSSVM